MQRLIFHFNCTYLPLVLDLNAEPIAQQHKSLYRKFKMELIK
jgi:hypothetical protein